jgi:hypothetical protein
VDSEKDPNCPVGRDCYGVEIIEGGNNQTDNLSNNLFNQLDVSSQGQGKGLQDVLSGQSDADTLRKMLLDAGMDKEILDQINDEDLMKAYEDTLNK